MRAFTLAAIAATTYAVQLREPSEDRQKEGSGDAPCDGECPLKDIDPRIGYLNAAGQMIAMVDTDGDEVVSAEEAAAALLELDEDIDEIELSEEDLKAADETFKAIAGEDEVLDKDELAGILEFGLFAIDDINKELGEDDGSAVEDYALASVLLTLTDVDGSLTVTPEEVGDTVEGFIRSETAKLVGTEEELSQDEIDALVADVRAEIDEGSEDLLAEVDLDEDGAISFAEAYIAIVEDYTEDWDLDEIAELDLECDEGKDGEGKPEKDGEGKAKKDGEGKPETDGEGKAKKDGEGKPETDVQAKAKKE